MMIDYISKIGVASSLLYGHVRAMSKFLVACFDIFKVFAAYSSISKYWRHFFPYLQGFVGIFLYFQSLGRYFLHLQSLGRDFLHLQSLDRDSLHFQHLVGISKILMSGYSAMHPQFLSYVAFENLC